MRDHLKTVPPDVAWSLLIGWVQTLQPFWEQAVVHIAQDSNFDMAKAEKHVAIIKNAFEFMNNWRFNKIKYVKTRRNEIDSAISFIRNHALERAVSQFRYGAVCRNAAGLLRGSLYLSTHGYQDKDVPAIIAREIYALAAVRTLFPVDTSDLVFYLPPGKSLHSNTGEDVFDNFHLMFDEAAKQLGLTEHVKAMNDMATHIWVNFDKPTPWDFPESIWTEKSDGLSSKLYYGNMAAFHNRS